MVLQTVLSPDRADGPQDQLADDPVVEVVEHAAAVAEGATPAAPPDGPRDPAIDGMFAASMTREHLMRYANPLSQSRISCVVKQICSLSSFRKKTSQFGNPSSLSPYIK